MGFNDCRPCTATNIATAIDHSEPRSPTQCGRCSSELDADSAPCIAPPPARLWTLLARQRCHPCGARSACEP
jgi:hypothetical protein